MLNGCVIVSPVQGASRLRLPAAGLGSGRQPCDDAAHFETSVVTMMEHIFVLGLLKNPPVVSCEADLAPVSVVFFLDADSGGKWTFLAAAPCWPRKLM